MADAARGPSVSTSSVVSTVDVNEDTSVTASCAFSCSDYDRIRQRAPLKRPARPTMTKTSSVVGVNPALFGAVADVEVP